MASAHTSEHMVRVALGNGSSQCLNPKGEPPPGILGDSPRQAESSEIVPSLDIHTTVPFGVNTWNKALSLCRS